MQKRKVGGGGQAGADVEITPEIVKAGAEEVLGFDPDRGSPKDVAVRVYRVMEAVRRSVGGLS